MRLLIVRHGQTDMNVQGILAGHLEAKLTDEGVRQAQRLSERLSGETIDVIYSSDLLRAKQTTDIISKNVNAPISYDARLRERTWGSMDASSVSEYRKKLEESPLPYHEFKSPDGESIVEVVARAGSFLSDLAKEEKNTVLVSAHHTLNKALLVNLLGLSWEEWVDLHQENTCVNELILHDDASWEALRINCAIHLKG